jgi:uncharacterized MAPEG superfamily protein
MNTRRFALAIAAVLVLPVTGHAQESGSTVTRAQVRAELVQLEGVGYRPGRAGDPHYPADIQAAEAAVASQENGASNVTSSVGGVQSGSSASGIRVTAGVAPANAQIGELYAHH